MNSRMNKVRMSVSDLKDRIMKITQSYQQIEAKMKGKKMKAI